MAGRKESQSTLFKSLLRQQRKQASLVRKIEKTSARLERRKARLQACEAGIAHLERRLSAPRQEHLGKQAGSDGRLKRARLIFNPTAGRDEKNNAERLAQIVSSLRVHGVEASVGLKTSGKAAREMAREAARSGAPLVIVAAGDGTIGDVAAELIGTSTALAIIPIGTMNNLARSLGVPLAIDHACALIGMGTTRHIDIGRMTSEGGSKAEYFMECAGIGLSAIAAFAGQEFVKRRWYHLPGAFRKFVEAKRGAIKVEMDGTLVEAATGIVTVSNAPLMAHNMLAAPGAKMDDGLLDVHIYDGMNDAALVKHFMAASSGSPDDLKTYRVRRVRMTAEEPVPGNSDMNITPQRHVMEIEVVPGAVSMVVGNGIALTVPVESAPNAPTFAPDPPHTNGAEAKNSAETQPSDAASNLR
ncbi:MAG TPA: diacylglycerol kinase family protein [Candidatus Eisenbacteria bacterium]|nr:diacylglycerol kinase family protein [Candidatus Eisenbacteria bacterium]